jgi:hypothetical protein
MISADCTLNHLRFQHFRSGNAYQDELLISANQYFRRLRWPSAVRLETAHRDAHQFRIAQLFDAHHTVVSSAF